MNKHRKNRTDAEKQVAVRDAILMHERVTGRAYLSTNQIANYIGMARNGRLKDMLDWMCETGTLERREMQRPGRWPGYEYALAEQVRKFYWRKRDIEVRSRGKKVSSLELWS